MSDFPEVFDARRAVGLRVAGDLIDEFGPRAVKAAAIAPGRYNRPRERYARLRIDAHGMVHFPGLPEPSVPAWRDVLRADPCAYCGGIGGALDHITKNVDGMLRRDGSWRPRPGTVRNLTGACRSCDAAKGCVRLIVFLAERTV